MKKIYSVLMMLAMMVTALSFTACGDDDDDVDNGSGGASLVIDGERCCPNEDSYINESQNAIQIEAYLPDNRLKQFHVSLRVWGYPFVVSELFVGEMFSPEDLEVRDFMKGIELRLYENEYTVTGGCITVESVTNSRVVMRFDNLSFSLKVSSNIFGEDYYPSNAKVHTINGTASFHNHLYKDGDWKPFY